MPIPIEAELDRLRAENKRLAAGLKHYVSLFCEGWCKDFPDGPYEDGDCSGCKARTILSKTAKEGEPIE